MPPITQQLLSEHHDFAASRALVERTLTGAAADLLQLFRFVGRYASWNGLFGSGVASLAGKIGRSRRLFLDPEQPLAAAADRSVFVASYFFDAARDEFDDRDTEHRDTHRCLAQALLLGVAGFAAEQGEGDARRLGDVSFANQLLAEPLWLSALNQRVRLGYGSGAVDDLPQIFRAIGYHLGSEVLADQEFSLIDSHLRQHRAPLVRDLERRKVEIAGQHHIAYQWIRIHSGHGGGAEADHFAWAVEGLERAFNYVRPEQRDALAHQSLLGFCDFAADHREFFGNVLAAG